MPATDEDHLTLNPSDIASMASSAGADSDAAPTSVYGLMLALHAEVIEAIDSSLSWDELQSPSVNYSCTRPIVERFAPKDDGSDDAGASLGAILYACMANRLQFDSLASNDLSYKPLQLTRSAFCELLAIKILRTFPYPNDEEELASQLVRQWCALAGAPEDVWKRVDDREEAAASKSSALELAIVARAKHFIAQPVVQHVLQEIGSGHLTYAPQATSSLISDTYMTPKHKARVRRAQLEGVNDGASEVDSVAAAEADAHGHDVEVNTYNPYRAGWLDYGRLRVPRWRHTIEFGTFALLIVLFLITLTNRKLGHITGIEVFFIMFTFGFILDEFASIRGSGLLVYMTNVWNAFDLSYMLIFCIYFVLRMMALANNDKNQSDLALDILACGACFLFPRLVFFFIKNNSVILSLQGMIATLVGFMALTTVAFTGIGFCVWRLATPKLSVQDTVMVMFSVWFGNARGNTWAREYVHPVLGPVVMTLYAFLCSHMLFSMMVSMMSSKFSSVQANAQQEYLFQRAVNTLEGVRADAVFSYVPPFNIPAVFILGPLSAYLDPKTMHRVNVFCIRLTNFPILLAISAYERHRYRTIHRAIRLSERGIHADSKHKSSLLNTFLGGGSEIVIHAAFDLAPPVPIDPPGTPTKDIERGATKLKPPKPQRPESESQRRGNANTLARLLTNTTRRGSSTAPEGVAATVTVSADEWAQMLESQKRLEDMLHKFMAVSGIDPATDDTKDKKDVKVEAGKDAKDDGKNKEPKPEPKDKGKAP